MAFIALFSSCKDNLPQRFDSFVSSVENNYSDYTEEYWISADEKYYRLVNEFEERRSSYTSDVKREINSIIARYDYRRFESLVSYVEMNYEEFSEDDWIGMNERFKELWSEYQGNKHSYNSSEKKKINSVITRYLKVVVMSKVPGLVEWARSLIMDLGFLG